MSNLDEVAVTNTNTTFLRVLSVPWITSYTTTHRGKLICLILCITAAILIISVVIILTTVIIKKEVDTITITTTAATTEIVATTTTTTKNDILSSMITKSDEDLYNANNTINIIQYKSVDYGTRRTRYWYAIETESLDDNWIRDSVIFRGYRTPENDTEPVYGYSFKAIYGWHNTLQMDLVPETSDANRWMMSGVKFYAYNTSIGSEKLRPIHRYWNDPKIQPSADDGFGRTYKLTIDIESEQSEWTFDKIVFYGLLPKK